MEKLLKRYENVEFTYYEPSTGRVMFHIVSRLKHITNATYSQYMEDPIGAVRIKSGLKLITISYRTVDESFTKVESDLNMLNYIVQNQDKKEFTPAIFSYSMPMAIKRLKDVGIDVFEFNKKTKSAEECLFELKD